MPGNRDAWAVFQWVRTQIIAAGFGIAGLQYSEVRRACRDLGVYRSPAIDAKIRALEKEMLANVNGSGKSKAKTKVNENAPRVRNRKRRKRSRP